MLFRKVVKQTSIQLHWMPLHWPISIKEQLNRLQVSLGLLYLRKWFKIYQSIVTAYILVSSFPNWMKPLRICFSEYRMRTRRYLALPPVFNFTSTTDVPNFGMISSKDLVRAEIIVTLGQTIAAYVIDEIMVYDTNACFHIENVYKRAIYAIRQQ